MKDKKSIVLSASRLKTLESCTWKYWSSYRLKIQSLSNNGARRGQICHSLFENLLNPRHKKHYEYIIKNRSIKGNPVIERFVNRQIKKEGLVDEFDNHGQNNLDLLESMILVGLSVDFFVENEKLEKAESEFLYESNNPKYTIRGFIDKLSTTQKDGKEFLNIWDYKGSRGRYEGEELESNRQALMYSLYAKRVRNMDAALNFIFLRFPDNPIQRLEFDEDEIDGFEHYLADITEYLEKFNYEDAISDMAASRGFPEKGEGFTKKLMCGFSQYPDQKKKDGSTRFSCEYKWPSEYYALIDEDGNTLKTSFKKKDLEKKKGCKIKKLIYAGCPAWTNTPEYLGWKQEQEANQEIK